MHRLAAAVAIALAAVVASAPARAGDPERVWRTIETAHFVISYYAPLDDVAHRIAVVAERAHRNLAPALDHEPAQKCQILILDDTDGANGFANVIPRNAITLFATAPTGSSNLNDHDDWLYGLVAHEYTHVLHLDTIGGLPKVVDDVVGKVWAPNQIQPRWIIEGIATYEETKRSAGGRGRNSTFDMYLRVPTLDGTALSLDQVTGLPLYFPQGNAAYLYGSHFLRYVFDRYGDRVLRDMSHGMGQDPVPFGINRQIARVIGRPFTELYDDWRGYRRDRAALQLEAVERNGRREGRQLTVSSNSNLAPIYTRDGKEIVWSQSDGWTQPRLRAMPVGGDAGQGRDVLTADRMGAFAIAADGTIVFEQTQLFRTEYNFQDLMRWRPGRDRVERLTWGARARDPAISPDGRTIAFSQNGGSASWIAVMANQPGATPRPLWKGARFDQGYAPAWSPDGSRVAFTAWRTGGLRDVVIIDVASGATTDVTHDRAIDGDPAWSPDGRWLYFTSDRTGITNVYAAELATGALWQVTNVIGGAFEPSVSVDGKRLADHGFDTGGLAHGSYDIFEVALDPKAWTPAAPYVDDRPPPTAVPDDEVAVTPARPYRAIETLAPQSVNLALSTDSFGQALSIVTGGGDTAGLVGWDLAATVGGERGDLSLGADVGYGGLRFPVRIAGSRSISLRSGLRVDGQNKSYTAEAWAGTLSASLPTESRADRSWSGGLDYNIDYERMVESPPVVLDPNQSRPRFPLLPILFSGVSARVSYGDIKGFAYTVGAVAGQDASVSVRFDHPALGADYRAITVSYAYRLFRRAPGGKTAALALRLTGGFHDGDQARPGFFALGGQPQQDVARSIVESTRAAFTGYLHGFPPRTVTGSQFHLLNVEYRHGIVDVERGLGTIPLYVKRLHAALLLDAGTAFERTISSDDLRLSVGGALRLDALFGYFVPGAFEIGYAQGLTKGGAGQAWLLLTGTL
jgi:WD40-like Beta Propeller Repeat